MNEIDRHVVNLFAHSVRQRFPEARVWAFGSRARGIATEESDLDVCVVVDDLTEADDRMIMELAWRTGFEHDVLISTVTYSREEFESGPCSESTLVQLILTEGVAA